MEKTLSRPEETLAYSFLVIETKEGKDKNSERPRDAKWRLPARAFFSKPFHGEEKDPECILQFPILRSFRSKFVDLWIIYQTDFQMSALARGLHSFIFTPRIVTFHQSELAIVNSPDSKIPYMEITNQMLVMADASKIPA